MKPAEKTIDEVFKMCDSRYALVGVVAKRARELADDACRRCEPLIVKPVNIVLANLKSGKSIIVRQGAQSSAAEDDEFDGAAEEAQEN